MKKRVDLNSEMLVALPNSQPTQGNRATYPSFRAGVLDKLIAGVATADDFGAEYATTQITFRATTNIHAGPSFTSMSALTYTVSLDAEARPLYMAVIKHNAATPPVITGAVFTGGHYVPGEVNYILVTLLSTGASPSVVYSYGLGSQVPLVSGADLEKSRLMVFDPVYKAWRHTGLNGNTIRYIPASQLSSTDGRLEMSFRPKVIVNAGSTYSLVRDDWGKDIILNLNADGIATLVCDNVSQYEGFWFYVIIYNPGKDVTTKWGAIRTNSVHPVVDVAPFAANIELASALIDPHTIVKGHGDKLGFVVNATEQFVLRSYETIADSVNGVALLKYRGSYPSITQINAIQFPAAGDFATTDLGGIYAYSSVDGWVSPSGTISWGSISGSIASQTDLAAALAGKSAVGHAHAISDVTSLQSILDAKAALAHLHSIADVTGLQLTLDAKAALSHAHVVGDVTGLQVLLDAKAALAHLHNISDINSLQTALDALSASISAISGHPDWTNKFRFIAGVIEKAAGSTTWALLAPGTQHTNRNVSSISSATGAYIDIFFSGLSVKNVLMTHAAMHKDGDARYKASTRGLLDRIQIYVRASTPMWQAFCTYNGTVWTITLTEGNGATISAQTAQTLTIDHASDYCIGVEILTPAVAGMSVRKGSTGYSYTQSVVALATAPASGDRFYIQRLRRDNWQVVNPNNIGNSFSPQEISDIWFLGIVEIN